ncbi:pyruvate kinase [bacterium]|nr:pyruvate kinase [bacterium]
MTKKNKTKIVCTIGPKTEDVPSISRLIEAGMTMARLNGSHNNLDWHIAVIKRIREVDPYLPILFDLPGRKIRTSQSNKNLAFDKQDQVVFTTDQHYSGFNKVVINYEKLHLDLKAGDTLLADDGTLKFTVLEIRGVDIFCQADVSGVLKPAKGINVPYIKMSAPLVSEKDSARIEMCKEQGVDFVGVSFVDSGEQLQEVYKQLSGSSIEVIAKVENQFGLDNLDSIVQNAFGILIDRGDLGAETKISNIPLMQKKIIKTANKYGKPVIVATEMLHTMIDNPFPTKSEVNDIANAVLDGASALMLSGETAVGDYPFEACRLMQEVALVTEESLNSNSGFDFEIENNTSDVVAKCINLACASLDITKIISVTYSGFSARMISLYRPKQSIFVVTDTVEKCRQLNLLWGVQASVSEFSFTPTDANNTKDALKNLYKKGVLVSKDTVIITAVRYPNPKVNTTMNFFEIHRIQDMTEIFSWD